MKQCFNNPRVDVVSNAVTNCLIIFKSTVKNIMDLHMSASSGNVCHIQGKHSWSYP